MPMDTTHIKRTTINELIDVLDFDGAFVLTIVTSSSKLIFISENTKRVNE